MSYEARLYDKDGGVDGRMFIEKPLTFLRVRNWKVNGNTFYLHPEKKSPKPVNIHLKTYRLEEESSGAVLIYKEI